VNIINRCTLEQLGTMAVTEIASLPIDHLALLLDDVSEREAALKGHKERLQQALAVRFGEAAAAERRASQKDTGTVSLDAGDGFVVRADLPKKVAWDAAGLDAAVAKLREWGEDPAEYVAVEVKVSETKYNAWPSSVRDLFTPARTVATGSPSYKLERAKRARAA
jgi:hypothetical protein